MGAFNSILTNAGQQIGNKLFGTPLSSQTGQFVNTLLSNDEAGVAKYLANAAYNQVAPVVTRGVLRPYELPVPVEAFKNVLGRSGASPIAPVSPMNNLPANRPTAGLNTPNTPIAAVGPGGKSMSSGQ